MKLTVRTYSAKELVFDCASFQSTNDNKLVLMDGAGIKAVFHPAGWFYAYVSAPDMPPPPEVDE